MFMLGFPPPPPIWLHFFFFSGNIVLLWQDRFQYFWTLQILRWLAFNCLWCLLPCCWPGWQVQPALHSQGREKPTDSCSFCNPSPSVELPKGWGTPACVLAAYHCLSTLYRYFNCWDIWCKICAGKSFPTVMVFKAPRYLVRRPGLRQAHCYVLWHPPFPWLISTWAEGKQ